VPARHYGASVSHSGNAFSIVSWNVEHFKDNRGRVDRVVSLVAAQDRDLLARYEVEAEKFVRASRQNSPFRILACSFCTWRAATSRVVSACANDGG